MLGFSRTHILVTSSLTEKSCLRTCYRKKILKIRKLSRVDKKNLTDDQFFFNHLKEKKTQDFPVKSLDFFVIVGG